MKESSGRNRVEDRIEVERKREATWKIISSIYGKADRRYFHFVSFTFVVFCVFLTEIIRSYVNIFIRQFVSATLRVTIENING